MKERNEDDQKKVYSDEEVKLGKYAAVLIWKALHAKQNGGDLSEKSQIPLEEGRFAKLVKDSSSDSSNFADDQLRAIIKKITSGKNSDDESEPNFCDKKREGASQIDDSNFQNAVVSCARTMLDNIKADKTSELLSQALRRIWQEKSTIHGNNSIRAVSWAALKNDLEQLGDDFQSANYDRNCAQKVEIILGALEELKNGEIKYSNVPLSNILADKNVQKDMQIEQNQAPLNLALRILGLNNTNEGSSEEGKRKINENAKILREIINKKENPRLAQEAFGLVLDLAKNPLENLDFLEKCQNQKQSPKNFQDEDKSALESAPIASKAIVAGLNSLRKQSEIYKAQTATILTNNSREI